MMTTILTFKLNAMTPNDVKIFLSSLQTIEKEMTIAKFHLIFGGVKAMRLWDDYRSMDYSLSLLVSVLSNEDKDSMCTYISKQLNKSHHETTNN